MSSYHSVAGSSKLDPVLGDRQGQCDNRKPLVVGVTHENDRNNHKGSANYNDNISAYMADFDYKKDFGRWLSVTIVDSPTPTLSIALDTVNFLETNVTGWPLQYGHLFVGVTDQTVASSLGGDITVAFDLRVRANAVSGNFKTEGYSGRRIFLGALGNWQETLPRTNTAHFLEVNISQTPGYSESFHEPQHSLCHDVQYDRCFYSDGRYAEGREVSLQTLLNGVAVADNSDQWYHVEVRLSELFRKLQWVSTPVSWGAARLQAIYFAIESTGATATSIEIRDYHVTLQH